MRQLAGLFRRIIETPASRHPDGDTERGAVVIELLWIVVLVVLVIGFMSVWEADQRKLEAEYHARNISLIRANLPPEEASNMEREHMSITSGGQSACRVVNGSQADTGGLVVVSVEVECRSGRASSNYSTRAFHSVRASGRCQAGGVEC